MSTKPTTRTVPARLFTRPWARLGLGLTLSLVLAACGSSSGPGGGGSSVGYQNGGKTGVKPWKLVVTLGVDTPALVSGYLSDQQWLLPGSSSGFGPIERDRSNGEAQAGDGDTISLSGVQYAKGLGVHADSSVIFNTAGACTSFESSIGLDNEVRGQTEHGSVIFQVFGAGTDDRNVKLYDSGPMTGATATKAIKVDLKGYRTLTLTVDQNRNDAEGDASLWSDHADWADARVTCEVTPTPAPPTTSTRIQAEDFKVGDEGVGYHDNDEANQGGLYRPYEGVDIDRRSGVDGFDVGWSGAGEWLDYDVNVATAGSYSLKLRALTFRAGQQVEISVDGVRVLTPTLPLSGDRNTFQTTEAGSLNLSAGAHVLRVAYVGPDPATNLDWMEFTRVGGTPPTTPPVNPPVTPPVTPPAQGPSVSTTFTGSSEDFPNPERGFHGYASDLAGEPNGSLATQADLKFRLVRTYVRLDAFRNSPLSADWLSRLDQGFNRARSSGLKVVLRFAYNFPGQDDTPDGNYEKAYDANLNQVLRHIEQLKPILARNADVVAFWQAGFVGAWGEWHDSSNNLDSDGNKVIIRDALLAAIPEGQFLQMRYPNDMRTWYPQAPTEADAFTNRARIGIYNDCFLAGPGDTGTYNGLNDSLREYTKALSKVTPFGAETCDVGGVSNLRMSCPDILREGRDYSLTYLNVDFYRPFIDGWKAQGCYDEVSRSIGYRFRLTKASHPASVSRGSALPIQLSVSNDGWSRLFSARPVKVVLRNRATGQKVEATASGTDPRRWLQGSSTDVTLSVNVSSQAAAGSYDVLIGLPDAASSLAGDARYSVRFANADDGSRNQGWEAGAGLFRLGTTLTIN